MIQRIWRDWISENVGYKVLAFFIALVIWVTLLGRRDFVVEEFLPLQLLVPQQHILKNKATRRVLVKVTGPRVALHNFSRNLPLISIDLASLRPGTHWVDVPSTNIDLPLGVKVLRIEPNQIKVQIALATKGQK